MRIYVSTVVWGEAYVRFFLDHALPSLLAPGNLPALAMRHRVVLLIHTDRSGHASINGHLYRHYADIAPLAVDYVLMDAEEIATVHKYDVMSACHRHLVAMAHARDAGIVFVMPDSIYADGSFRSLLPGIAEGRRAILMQGISAARDGVLPALAASPRASRRGGILSIPARPLMRLALDHLHPVTESQFVDAPDFTAHPSFLRWRLGADGCLTHCWHLFPLFVHPVRRADGFLTTIDGDFVGHAVPCADDRMVIGDSDDFLMVEVSDSGKRDFIADRPADPQRVARWARANADTDHRHSVRTPMVFHDGADPRLLQAVRQQAATYIEDILSRLQAMDGVNRQHSDLPHKAVPVGVPPISFSP